MVIDSRAGDFLSSVELSPLEAAYLAEGVPRAVGATLAGCDARDHVRAVLDTLARVKCAGASGDPLHQEPCIFVDENRHSLGRFTFMNHQFVSIRIAQLRHPTNRGLGFFEIEFDSPLL